MVRRIAVALAALAAAGCTTVGPNYRLPDKAFVNAPSAQGPFVSAKDARAATADEPPGDWWRLYRDPTLDRLVGQALAANTDLRVAEANLERSRALVKEAEAARQPNLSFNFSPSIAQLAPEQYLLQEPLPVFSLYDVGLTVSYELDLFGGLKRGIEAARADDETVEAARDLARVAVAADVARAYADLCGAGAELAAAQRSLALQQQNLDSVRRLQQGGRLGRLDVVRFQGQVEQFRASIPLLLARRRNAQFRLAVLAGRPPAEFEPALASCAAPPRLAQPLPVGDGAALLRRRPDVRAAERRLAAATARIGVAAAAVYPNVSLGASAGSTGAVSTAFSQPTLRYGIGPNIRWELNHNGARARVEAAGAVTKAELARFDGVVLAALGEVESALTTYVHDLDREAALGAARTQAETALADAQRLQSAGRTGSLTVLDAERVLAGVDSGLAALRSQVAADQVAVFRALGGGWQTADKAPAPR